MHSWVKISNVTWVPIIVRANAVSQININTLFFHQIFYLVNPFLKFT